MNFLAAALAVWIAGGLACLPAGRNRRAAGWIGAVTAVAGSILALAGCLPVLLSAAGSPALRLELPWSMPSGRLMLACDGLAAIFVGVTALVTALASIYGAGYLRHAPAGRPFGLTGCLLNLLTASMVGVFLAANALFFLLAWEIMALASFGLVMFDHDRPHVRRAALIYLVAMHLGTAMLLAMFLLLGREAHGSLDFQDFRVALQGSQVAGSIFILAVLGFGAKAGLMPLHVWLPEAHPAAPSHVSAVMSGVMIKTGIYGIMRILSLLSHPPAWWGAVLVAAGAVSAVVGILFALAQRDLKRMLAYSSVENIGMIVMGLGIGLLGITAGSPVMTLLGFAGALMHVFNHAIIKSLLFLGAGAVMQGAGTAVIDRLGGLSRRMPWTGNAFLTGAAAISGLPPFNGFMGEMLLVLGALAPLYDPAAGTLALTLAGGLSAAIALTVSATLALACFVRAFGIIFLGEPRDDGTAGMAGDPDRSMRFPLILLASACPVFGLSAPLLFRAVLPAVSVLTGANSIPGLATAEIPFAQALRLVSLSAAGVVILALLLYAFRLALLRGRTVASTVTWDCGYAAPAASMQYTASSFAQPILRVVSRIMMARRRFVAPSGLFPAQAAFSSETPDIYEERLYKPLFGWLERILGRVQGMQHGKLSYYILYIVLALLALLAWKIK